MILIMCEDVKATKSCPTISKCNKIPFLTIKSKLSCDGINKSQELVGAIARKYTYSLIASNTVPKDPLPRCSPLVQDTILRLNIAFADIAMASDAEGLSELSAEGS